MILSELLSGIATTRVYGSLDSSVTSVCSDSRTVVPGSVFVAVSGARAQGIDFVSEAVKKGAVAIVSEAPISDGRVVSVEVADARKALADIARAFYGKPSDSLKVAGITGTNGKTTTAFLVRHICDAAQLRCGMIGTVQYQIGDKTIPASRTTPDAVELQSLLAQMRDAGCKSVAMEVSSHAVVQNRIRGVDFDTAVFTNLTQDHLDYHGTMESYFEAKAGFLLGLDGQRFKVGTAVVNVDDRYGALLYDRLLQTGVKTISYGLGSRAEFRASNCRTDLQGSSFQLDACGKSWLVRLPLIGMFNIYNALAALAASHAMGVDLRTAVLSLASAATVPGRLEPVPGKRSFRIFVDYAHTDDALNNVLRTLRDLNPRRLITVFGCGGDRDQAKRPLMGLAAEQGSDWVIVTSDNPRSEAPGEIVSQITAGMRRSGYEVVLDRKAAIAKAVEMAGPRDIVLIAGKGHEVTQETAGRFEPFSDVGVARAALESRPVDFGR